MLYKMKNNLTLEYLSNIVPTMAGQNSKYALRTSDNLQTIHSRTTLYYNSFLPSSIGKWNTLSLEIQNAESLRLLLYKTYYEITSIELPWGYVFTGIT